MSPTDPRAAALDATLCSREFEAVERALARLLPEGAAFALSRVGDHSASLFPEEKAAIQRSVAKRSNEFSSGRLCARKAFALLGRQAAPIASGSRREPVWPAGVVGSLSHTAELAAAIVAPSPPFRSLGVDIERIDDVGPELLGTIAGKDEVERSRAAVGDAGLPASLFAIREAVYKAYDPVTRHFLAFRDVELFLEPAAEAFEARLTNSRAPPTPCGRSIRGRFAVAGGFIVAVACI